MFKNALIYTITNAPQDIEAMQSVLASMSFQPLGATQEKSCGWVPPRGHQHGALVESVNGQRIMRFQIETKSVPGPVVKRHLDERTAKIYESDGRKPGRKECREIKEQIVHDLLPQAFPKTVSVWVWFDIENHRLVLDTVSESRADDVITALVKCLDGLKISPLSTQTAPHAAMTHWLMGGDDAWPENFAPGRHVELESTDEMRSRVMFDRHALDDEQMRLHIGQGKFPIKLALNWDGRVSFVLTEDTQLRKIELSDDVLAADGFSSNEDDFDADVSIATGELSRLIDEITQALGGELE